MNIPTYYISNIASKSTSRILVTMRNFEVIQYLHLHKHVLHNNEDNKNTNKQIVLEMYATRK